MNLIICCTPLQVLIAEKIIEQHPNETFFGVMLYTVSNKKFDYYMQRLEKKCQLFFSMQQHSDRINLIKEIITLKRTFCRKKFKHVFVANINELQIQFLLSAIRFEQLNTFDDGTANIINNGIFYKEEPKTLMRKLVNTFLGNKYSLTKLKALSQAHYTLYKDAPNIIKNTIFTNLIEKSTACSGDKVPVNILLGQPVYADDKKNITLANKVIEQFNIDLYLPHPREKYHLDKVNYIDTELIFEDYIAQEFSNKKCRIYTYFSSAVLNILNKSENIEVVALRIDVSEPAYIACYELFAKQNIQIIDIRDTK